MDQIIQTVKQLQLASVVKSTNRSFKLSVQVQIKAFIFGLKREINQILIALVLQLTDMIRNQPRQGAIRYTDGKRINLRLLKAEIDRKMLKINMFLNNMPDQSPPLYSKKQKKLHEQGVQTDKVSNNSSDQMNIFQNSLMDEAFRKVDNEFEMSKSGHTKQVLGQSSEYIRNKSNSVFIQTKASLDDIKTNKNVQEFGAQTLSQSGFELSKIQDIKYISPIKFIKYPRTDRTQKSFTKKINQQFRILVDLQKMAKMQAQVKATIPKNRKEVTDPKIRENLIKKIEEKFKSTLQKQKNL